MKRLFMSMLLLLALCTHTYAQTENSAFAAEVKKAFELQKLKENYVEGLKMGLEPLVAQGKITTENLNLYIKEVADYATPFILQAMEKFYVENYTLEEMRQMNAYMSSPVGQKTLRLTPKIMIVMQDVLSQSGVQAKAQELLLPYLTR